MKQFSWKIALGEFKAEGEGASKKEAKAMAAEKLLEILPETVVNCQKKAPAKVVEIKNGTCKIPEATVQEMTKVSGQGGAVGSNIGASSNCTNSAEKITASVLQPAIKNSSMAIHELSTRTGMTLEWISVGYT